MHSSASVFVLLIVSTLFCCAPLGSYGKEDLDSDHAPYNILSSSSIGKPGLVSAGSDDDASEFPIRPPEHPTFPPWVSHPPPEHPTLPPPEHPSFPPWVTHPPPEHFPSPPPWISHPPPPEKHLAPPPPHQKPPPPHEKPPPPPHHLPPPPAPPPHFPAATLADLKISKGKLSPKFDPKVHNYSASVGSGVKKIRITAVVPEHEGKDEYTVTVNSIPVKSGVPSPQLHVGKAGKTVLFEVSVTALEHEPSTYYISVHRGKSKWSSFGAKFLLALAIILIVAVVAFLAYAIYLCVKTGRMPTFWPFSYFARDRGGDEYSSLGPGPSRP